MRFELTVQLLPGDARLDGHRLLRGIDRQDILHPVKIDDDPLPDRDDASVARRALAPGDQADVPGLRPAEEDRQLLFTLGLDDGVGDGPPDDRLEKTGDGCNIVSVEDAFGRAEIGPGAELLLQPFPVFLAQPAHVFAPLWVILRRPFPATLNLDGDEG